VRDVLRELRTLRDEHVDGFEWRLAFAGDA
jgi:hypothetical protein